MPERLQLIARQPVFAQFSLAEQKGLANLMKKVTYSAGERIVAEEEWVDSVFIIAKGKAEVSLSKPNKIPIATLHEGETIGLTDTGFFSTTGKRTATVTAISNMTLFKIMLKDLHQFLQRHEHLEKTLYLAADTMLKMQLIKQSLPFSHLSEERVAWLTKQIKNISVPAGDFVFKEGDAGNECYLIREGQVEIFTFDESGNERRLSILKSPMIFGEATLITQAPRNAYARALENCELLMLKKEFLSELIETEHNVADTLMNLMVDRSRPLQAEEVSVHQRTTQDLQLTTILKNHRNHQYFKLSEEGWFIWQQLNGHKTMQEITLALADKFNIFSPDLVAGLISKLAKAGFIKQVEIRQIETKKQPFWTSALSGIRDILEIRKSFPADAFISFLYRKTARVLFNRWTRILFFIVALSGLGVFGWMTNETIETFNIMPHVWVLFIPLIPFTLISVVLHELGHALMTKAFGFQVHYMGIGWYWLSPVAFTDTSDMWLSTKGPRMIVSLAGIYVDLLTAGISALLILVFSNPYIQAFLWFFSLFTYINAFRMLSPLQELDGYYALMDLFEHPHLREDAVKWLIRKPQFKKKYRAEIIYWILCILFLLMISLITLFLQTFILKILGFKAHVLLSLLLPILVTVISALGIIADIRQHQES